MTEAARLTAAEIEERKLLRRQWGLDRPRSDVVSIATRRPLGLGIVRDADNSNDVDEAHHDLTRALGFSFLDGHTREQLDMPATVELVYVACDAAASMADTVREQAKEGLAALKAKMVELETEHARARALTAELKSKLHEVDFIVERLRVEGKGPAGPPGPRGRDGADGARGPRGERGAMGPPGPRIVSWENDDSAFVAWPLGSDGRKAAPLYLRGMFEQYHAQTEGEDAEEEAEAAAASRRAVEEEASRVRRGLPAR